MNEYGGAVSAVLSLYKKGIKAGTAVTRGILDNLGKPDTALKTIHVAGTNGKGSTCEYLTQILLAAGKSVGTFQSPAVYDYREQFKINGKPIEIFELQTCLESALAAAEGFDATGFEVETAAALLAFWRAGCEYAVLECGMGGKDDATNAVEKKQLAVITSIGLEHTAHLGDTLEKICAHKAGIIKNCPAVVCAFQPQEVTKYFKNLNAVFADGEIKITQSGLFGQSFLYRGKPFKLLMAGEVQAYNAAAAIEAARLLQIDETFIYNGLKSAKIGGRAEVLSGKTTYILDGAHNPAGLEAFADFLKKHVDCNDLVIIFGCLSDKDVLGNVKALSGAAKKIIAVQPNTARAMDIDKIFGACKKFFNSAIAAQSVSAALEAASASGKTVAVCGTFTVLREAKAWIEKRP